MKKPMTSDPWDFHSSGMLLSVDGYLAIDCTLITNLMH